MLNEINTSKFILYASYPKTGSTFLPDLIEKWGRSYMPSKMIYCESHEGKTSLRLNGKFYLTYVTKTHHTVGDFNRKLRKNYNKNSIINTEIKEHSVDFFDGKKCSYIYTVRNPFNVLISAISYSKLLYSRPNVRETWMLDGRAKRFFIDLLGFQSIPEVNNFVNFSLLDLDDDQIEDIVWRFLDTAGSIPIFEPGDMLSYFRHVNYYDKFLSPEKEFTILSYEGLMNRDTKMLKRVSDILDISSDEFISAYDADQWEKNNGSAKYKSAFYTTFRTQTPEKIKNLKTYGKMKKYIACVCPSLSSLID